MVDRTWLTGRSVLLRALEPSDTEQLCRWMSDPSVTRYLVVGRFPLNSVREEEWIRSHYKSHDSIPFGICTRHDRRLIGACGLHDISWVDRFASIGIFIGEETQWGKGLGTEAFGLVVEYGFEVLNLQRVELQVFDFNTRAIRSYEKIGFREEGRLRQKRYKEGRYCDEVLMGLLRDDWREQRKAIVSP